MSRMGIVLGLFASLGLHGWLLWASEPRTLFGEHQPEPPQTELTQAVEVRPVPTDPQPARAPQDADQDGPASEAQAEEPTPSDDEPAPPLERTHEPPRVDAEPPFTTRTPRPEPPPRTRSTAL